MFTRVNQQPCLLLGVADQLQTNCAGDLRCILKSVFISSGESELETCTSSTTSTTTATSTTTTTSSSSSSSTTIDEEDQDTLVIGSSHHQQQPQHTGKSSSETDNSTVSRDSCLRNSSSTRNSNSGPAWVPDGNVSQCSSCHSHFNLMRRKHHCRNCGLVSFIKYLLKLKINIYIYLYLTLYQLRY